MYSLRPPLQFLCNSRTSQSPSIPERSTLRSRSHGTGIRTAGLCPILFAWSCSLVCAATKSGRRAVPLQMDKALCYDEEQA